MKIRSILGLIIGIIGLAHGPNRSLAQNYLPIDQANTMAVSATHLVIINPNGTVMEANLNFLSSGYHPHLHWTGDFARVKNLSSIVAVAAGESHRLALRADGTVWAWGGGSRGQLGLGNYNDQTLPVAIPGLTGVIAISAGANHSVALKDDGTVLAWGDNSEGQLGNGLAYYYGSGAAYYPQPQPILIKNEAGVGEPISDVIAISANFLHTFLLRADRTVWGCGSNRAGQLAMVEDSGSYSSWPRQFDLQNIVQIAAGQGFGLALDQNGVVWSWGCNQYGSLGNREPHEQENSTLARYFTNPTPIQDPLAEPDSNGDRPAWSNVSRIRAGADHALAQTADGSLWVWGDGEGVAEYTGQFHSGCNYPLPIVGASHAIAFCAGGRYTYASFLAPGPVADIRLLSNENTENYVIDGLPPAMRAGSCIIPLGRYQSAQMTKLSMGYLTAAVHEDGKLRTCGTRASSTVPVVLEEIPTVASTAGTYMYSNANWADFSLLSTGQLVEWRRYYSNPGSSAITEIEPTLINGGDNVVSIAVSRVPGSSSVTRALVALKADGSVWLLDNQHNLVQQADGGAFAGMTGMVNLSGLTDIIQVAAGSNHCAALDRSGHVWTWGKNSFGQLGDGTVTDRLSPVEVSGLENVAFLACGSLSTHVIARDGKVYAWGLEASLGRGSSAITAVKTPVEIPQLSGRIVSLSGGMVNYMAIGRNGDVYVWGRRNTEGQLGDGGVAPRYLPYMLPNANLSNVVEVWPGQEDSLFRTESGAIYGCGRNAFAHLGLDNTQVQMQPVLSLFRFSEP